MSKKEEIIDFADSYIRKCGYDGFSFNDISKDIGIKTSSIHYHFPTKKDVALAVIDRHQQILTNIIKSNEQCSNIEKLDILCRIYLSIEKDHKVCIIGSLSSHLSTYNECIRNRLKEFTTLMLNWVTRFLEAGKTTGEFQFHEEARTKALLILSNLLAGIQLVQITHKNDLEIIVNALKNNLIKNKT